MPRRWVIWDSIPQLCLPCQREDGRANIYEPAKVGYIFNYTTYRGALFKGSRQVGAIATTCLRVSHFLYIPLSLAMLAVPPCVRRTFYGLNLYLSPFNSPFIKRGTRYWDRLGGIKVISCRICRFPTGASAGQRCTRAVTVRALTFALTHLTSARTAGVRCAMKCLVRPFIKRGTRLYNMPPQYGKAAARCTARGGVFVWVVFK